MHLFRYGSTGIDHLRKRDRILGKVIDGTGMIERPVTQDIFTALVASACRSAGLGKGCGNSLEPEGKDGRYHNAGCHRCNNRE